MMTHSPSLFAGLAACFVSLPLALAQESQLDHGYEVLGMHLVAEIPTTTFLPIQGHPIDVWSYLSPGGREYALVALERGYSFLDITNPQQPVEVWSQVEPGVSFEREIRTYGEYAYVCSATWGSTYAVDLTQIDSGTVTPLPSFGPSGSHTLEVDQLNGKLYQFYTGFGDTLHVYSLADPSTPQNLESGSFGYPHHGVVRVPSSGPFAGRELLYGSSVVNFSNLRLATYDVTDDQSIQSLDSLQVVTASFVNEVAVSSDLSYAFVSDAQDEIDSDLPTRTYAFDVSDPTQILVGKPIIGDSKSPDTTLQVVGDLLYCGVTTSGARVYDISSPGSPVLIGEFDTYPEGDGQFLVGAVSVHAGLPGGRVLVADTERGLFVLGVGERPLGFEFAGGPPGIVDPAGALVPMQILPSLAGDRLAGSETLFVDTGAGFQPIALLPQGGDSFLAPFPQATCGQELSWYLEAQTLDGVVWRYPFSQPEETLRSTVAAFEDVLVADPLDQPGGWSVGAPADTATSGIWAFGDPVGTAAQPEDDHSPVGSTCWFTGAGAAGGALGEQDVDGGATTLLSPTYDVGGLDRAALSYWRWYSNDEGFAAGMDTFVIEASGDGGFTWFPVETVGPLGQETQGGWYQHRFLVDDVLPGASEVQLRFVASDLGSASIIEAAIDDLELSYLSCEGPLGERFCTPALPNSSGSPARIEAYGQLSVGANSLTLLAANLPVSQAGYFLAALQQAPPFVPPGSEGALCLGSPVIRFRELIAFSGSAGAFSADPDLSAFPAPYGGAVLPGQSWSFQAWYRDANPGPTSNFTDVLELTFE